MSDSVTAAPAVSPPPPPKDTLGCVASLLSKDVETATAACGCTANAREAHVEHIDMPACDRGFLVGVSLAAGHRRTLYGRAGASERRFQHHSIYIRDFSRHFHADLYGNFDFVLVELPHAYLERVGPEHGGQAIGGLTCRPDVRDPVLGHLAHAVAGSLDAPGPLNALFIEQPRSARTSCAVTATRTRELDKGSLSPAKLARAQELLLEKADLGVSIEEVANECDLSRGFIRAFSRTTGRTPHQWLLEQRVTRARELIETSDMTLADIAIACGFADQSHLNRIFARIVGHPPGAWRRARSR